MDEGQIYDKVEICKSPSGMDSENRTQGLRICTFNTLGEKTRFKLRHLNCIWNSYDYDVTLHKLPDFLNRVRLETYLNVKWDSST